jgi:hypothetical protein
MTEFQLRVVDEKAQLDDKIAKLTDFFVNPIYENLPSDERIRLHLQWDAMTRYSKILGERIEAFQ